MTVAKLQDRILDLLEHKGWSKYRLSKETGIPENTVYNIFKRKTMPKLDTIVIICNAFEISVGEFFAFDIEHTDGHLTKNDVALVGIAHALPEKQQEKLIDVAKGMKFATESGDMNL